MTTEQLWLVVGCLAVALAAVVLLCLRSAVALRRELDHELLTSRAELALLTQRVADLEASSAAASDVAQASSAVGGVQQEASYLITHVGEQPAVVAPDAPAAYEGRMFADVVARETIVKAASMAHGVRRALAPETRNRVRFEMKREVKRNRKNRKSEMKQAWREYQARQRSGVTFGEEPL